MAEIPKLFESLIPNCPARTVMSTRASDFDINSPPLDGPLFRMQQTHSNHYRWVTGEYAMCPLDTDALMSSTPGHILALSFADCLPVLLYHPTGVIAAIHAGRRGSLSGITGRVLEQIRKNAGDLHGLKAYFGPSISGKRYQISTQLYYNMVAANTQQILTLAADAEIHYSPYCTYNNHDLFYSYRYGDLKARNCCFIQLP